MLFSCSFNLIARWSVSWINDQKWLICIIHPSIAYNQIETLNHKMYSIVSEIFIL